MRKIFFILVLLPFLGISQNPASFASGIRLPNATEQTAVPRILVMDANGNITGFINKTDLELALGNPTTDGQILSSTIAGVRSWIDAPSGGGALTVQDEGSPLTTDATTLNFTGPGVTASGTGATKTINIPGGASGLPEDLFLKENVDVATTGNITLSGTQTIDGVSVVAGTRVLVKDQTTGSQNGIYVAAVGAWSRSEDANTTQDITRSLVYVTFGSTNGNKFFQTNFASPDVLGTQTPVFNEVDLYSSGGGVIAEGSVTIVDAQNNYVIPHGLSFTPSLSRIVGIMGFQSTIPVNAISADATNITLNISSTVGIVGNLFYWAILGASTEGGGGITAGTKNDINVVDIGNDWQIVNGSVEPQDLEGWTGVNSVAQDGFIPMYDSTNDNFGTINGSDLARTSDLQPDYSVVSLVSGTTLTSSHMSNVQNGKVLLTQSASDERTITVDNLSSAIDMQIFADVDTQSGSFVFTEGTGMSFFGKDNNGSTKGANNAVRITNFGNANGVEKSNGNIKWAGDFLWFTFTTCTPLANNQHTEANAASDPNCNEANATTGWSRTPVGATLSSVQNASVGQYSLRLEQNSAGAFYMLYTFAATSGDVFEVNWDWRSTQGSNVFATAWQNVTGGPSFLGGVTSVWASAPTQTITASSTGNIELRFYSSSAGSGAIGDNIYIDNLSIVKTN